MFVSYLSQRNLPLTILAGLFPDILTYIIDLELLVDILSTMKLRLSRDMQMSFFKMF